jgi:ribosome-binding protein aMBF1 (putative translation factor)
VRIAHDNRQFRVLFATEGRYSQVLLAVEAFTKKTQHVWRDFLEDQVDDLRAAAEKWSRENPEYANLEEAYRANQQLINCLVEQRVALGLSQRQVAERMGTSQSALNRIEAGETDPRLSTIQRLAVALGCTIRWELVSVEKPVVAASTCTRATSN